VRTTVNLDETLLARAQAVCGMRKPSRLLNEALNALIERESARRLARMDGTEPHLMDIRRRRESDE
jgi:Arc/MetJ family transcription regulator